MNHDEQAIEQEIQDKQLNAPRVTPTMIDELMAQTTTEVVRIGSTTTMVAVTFDSKGFSLAIGMSACASPENFDVEIGTKIAVQDAETKARNELWKLEGYKLKHSL